MFARRLSILLGALVGLILVGTVAFTITEGSSVAYSFAWTLDTVTTLGSIQDPHDAAGRVVVVALGAVRHRYALLRPGDGGGVLRLRPAERAARANGARSA